MNLAKNNDALAFMTIIIVLLLFGGLGAGIYLGGGLEGIIEGIAGVFLPFVIIIVLGSIMVAGLRYIKSGGAKFLFFIVIGICLVITILYAMGTPLPWEV